MFASQPGLMDAIRDQFAQIDTCPYQGPRVFFENAGGALTLKKVVETSREFAALPDNQGRANVASAASMKIIADAKAAAMTFLNAKEGQVFVGESGTELLFRMISNAILAADEGGNVVGTTLEHPASRSAAQRWAKIARQTYLSVPHNDDTGTVEAADYACVVNSDTRVATIVHTSPVTGMAVDVEAVAKVVRVAAPDCLIIVDGIQHAAHGRLDIASYGIDGYAISPYKVFSRHGYGIAWISDRLSALPHDSLIDGPEGNWELGTRDTSAYATFSDVVNYFSWLGSQFTASTDLREQLVAAGVAIHDHEKQLTDAMLHGLDNHRGLAAMPEVSIIGGIENPRREGLVAMNVQNMAATDVVEELGKRGIRVHVRKADHYSGNILNPLKLDACVRVSMCHYNSLDEVKAFLSAMEELLTLSASNA